ncbi:ABC transporter ATP-binding protein/permease [Oligoflexaceae bacterium]|nr:ABC transporter ATP-binding protein/permease [Oligoflexaceae bacterium]
MSDQTLRLHLTPFFKQKSGAILAVTILSLALGLVTAALGLAMGPAFEILFGDRERFMIADLLGPYLSSLWTALGWQQEFSRTAVLELMPLLLVSLSVFKFIASFSIFYFWESFSESINFNLRGHIVKSFLETKPERVFSDEYRHLGNKMPTVIANDLTQVRQYVVRFFGSMPREVFQAFFLIVAMILLSPKLFGLFIITVAPCAFVIQKISKKVKRRSRIVLENFSEMSDWLLKRILGFETVKQMGTEDLEVEKMGVKSKELTAKFFAVARAKAVAAPLVEAASVAAVGLVLYLSYQMVDAQTASASTQISFFSCLALLAQASAKFGRYVNIGAEGQAALTKLRSFDREILQASAAFPSHTNAQLQDDIAIDVRQLRKSLPGGFTLSVDRFQCAFGEWCGVKGESGSGKSTFLAILAGQLEEYSGQVGLHTSQDDSISLIYLNQNFKPFFGSVAENVCYPLPYSLEFKGRVEAALNDAVWQNVRNADDIIGFGDAAVSGGQLQRLGLARLFFHRPKLALLDECTSALDQKTEQLILQSIRGLADSGSCVVMTAHRPAALGACNRVVNFNAGVLSRD